MSLKNGSARLIIVKGGETMDSGKKFKAAMIGAGSRSNSVIYPSLADLEDVEIVAVCDIDEERLAKTADKYGIEKRYGKSADDYRRMIREVDPDAVFAIGQPHIFYDIWMWCLEHGLNLYIEKQLGPREIIALGHDEALVKRILRLVNISEFKRYQTAPVLRISSKAFGMGRRMPIVGKYLA